MSMQSIDTRSHLYATGYDGVAKFLHWLVVVLITAQFIIGWTMPDIHKGTRPEGLIAWHLGVGAALVSAALIGIGLSRLSGDARKPSVTLDQMQRDKVAVKEMIR